MSTRPARMGDLSEFLGVRFYSRKTSRAKGTTKGEERSGGERKRKRDYVAVVWCRVNALRCIRLDSSETARFEWTTMGTTWPVSISIKYFKNRTALRRRF